MSIRKPTRAEVAKFLSTQARLLRVKSLSVAMFVYSLALYVWFADNAIANLAVGWVAVGAVAHLWGNARMRAWEGRCPCATCRAKVARRK